MIRHISTVLVIALMVIAGVACEGPEYKGRVPDIAHCDPVGDWESSWISEEARLLQLINYVRAIGANCGKTYYPPVSELKPDQHLICAARLHSMDMHDNDYFSHTSLDGRSASDRAADAGLTDAGWVGENIAAGGNVDGEGAMTMWMQSEGHCRAIMNPDFTHIGPGYYPGGSASFGQYWTLNFTRKN